MQSAAAKVPVERLTAERIHRMTPEEIGAYTDSERAQMDAILNASYDRWQRGERLAWLLIKVAIAGAALFIVVRFVKWAWYF